MSEVGTGGAEEEVTALPHLPSLSLPFPPPLPRAATHRAPSWSPQEEQALRELYWKYKEVEGTGGVWGAAGPPPGGLHPCSLSPPTGQDVIAAILAELPAPGRTRRQVVKHLVRLGLANSAKDFPQQR